MHEYKLSSAFFSRMRRRILTVGLPLSILAAAVGLWAASRGDLSSPVAWVAALLILLTLGISIRQSVRRQEQSWSSYRVILDEAAIIRRQAELPEITIPYGEIVRITEAADLGLGIQGTSASQQIGVPQTLENYAEFRAELARRHAIESMPEARSKSLQALPILTALLALAAFAITFTAANRYVVAVVGTLLFAGMLLSLVSIQRNPNSTKQVRRNSWLVLIVLLAIAVRVYFAISAR